MGCYNSIVVKAPLAAVWAAVRDFHDLTWAAGVVESCQPVGGLAGTQVGARRVLNGAFRETLLELSDLDHRVRYSIDDGPGPVAKEVVKNYVGTIELHAVTSDDTTFVAWTSTYEAPDSPAVGAFCNPVYQALLGALASRFK